MESNQGAKNKQRLYSSPGTQLVLSELNFKLELFFNMLKKGEETSLSLFKETQNGFFDTFNIESLTKLLKVLEKKFLGLASKSDYKSKKQTYQALDPIRNPLIDTYVKLSRLIYRSLYMLTMRNPKTSSGAMELVDIYSVQIYGFNKEIRKLIGSSIPCSMPSLPKPANSVEKWFKLLLPLSKTSNDDNIMDQLIPLKALRGLCLGNEGKGNVTNQRACLKFLQATANITLGFGVEESRPFISFCKFEKSNQTFLNNNPALSSYSRTLEYNKGKDKDIKMFCVHLDDLSKHLKNTLEYIYYVSYVLQLFSAMCVGRFNAGIKELTNRGLNWHHLNNCLKMGTPALHPKLMQAYIELTRVLCIDVDPLTSILTSVNRCYL